MQQNGDFYRTPVDLQLRMGSHTVRIDAGLGLFTESGNIFSYTHSHVTYDVHYLTRGEYLVDIAGRTVRLTAGQFLVIAPGVYHSVKNSEPATEPPRRVSFNFSFHGGPDKPRSVPDIESAAVLGAFRSLRGYAVIADDFNGASLFSVIGGEFAGRRTGYYLRMQNAVSDLLVELARRLEARPTAVSPPEKTPADRQPEILDDFFDPNLLKNPSKSELAGRLGVSIRQVDRIMLERFGISFREKLLECRVELAKHLLSSGGLTVQAISELTGYGFESSLHKVFKKQTGMTPAEYRARSRQEPRKG